MQPIGQFTIRDQRSVKFAECNDVPPVMVITGPNGSGKSTLLIGIKRLHQSTNPIYLGPHRSIRRQNIQNRWLGPNLKMSDVMASDSVSRLDGLSIYDQSRDPWNADESGNLIKYSLCNIATDINSKIAKIFFRDGKIDAGKIPDIWEPLYTLIETLLPHLRFSAINVDDKTNMQVLFANVKTDLLIEFDDLSSGEKAVIQLFLPLIENEIVDNLDKIEHPETIFQPQTRAVIFDEPELHLHPNLQETLISYMRELATAGKYQFIISSHSQPLVEAAGSNELYLLRPAYSVEDGANQLIKVASDEERLDMILEVFGRPSNLTAMKSIVVVEGKELSESSQSSSDKKIYSLLDKRFRTVTVMPSASKTEAINRAKNLRSALEQFSSTASVVALVDSDVTEHHHEIVRPLPVSMVENFLIDPQVIYDAIEIIREKTDFVLVEQVEDAINAILDSMESHEVERRVKEKLGVVFFRAKGPLDRLAIGFQDFVASAQIRYSEESVTQARSAAKEDVRKIIEQNNRRERYDGKHVLDEFVRIYMAHSGMSKEIFKYSCARVASKRKSVKGFFDQLFKDV